MAVQWAGCGRLGPVRLEGGVGGDWDHPQAHLRVLRRDQSPDPGLGPGSNPGFPEQVASPALSFLLINWRW